MEPIGAPFKVVVVDRMSHSTFELLGERGAVGLVRASYGPTTNRRRALAELVRGAEVNARLGGVPAGKPAINTSKAPVYRDCRMCIVIKLPARGAPSANVRLYRIAVIGLGRHRLCGCGRPLRPVRRARAVAGAFSRARRTSRHRAAPALTGYFRLAFAPATQPGA